MFKEMGLFAVGGIGLYWVLSQLGRIIPIPLPPPLVGEAEFGTLQAAWVPRLGAKVTIGDTVGAQIVVDHKGRGGNFYVGFGVARATVGHGFVHTGGWFYQAVSFADDVDFKTYSVTIEGQWPDVGEGVYDCLVFVQAVGQPLNPDGSGMLLTNWSDDVFEQYNLPPPVGYTSFSGLEAVWEAEGKPGYTYIRVMPGWEFGATMSVYHIGPPQRWTVGFGIAQARAGFIFPHSPIRRFFEVEVDFGNDATWRRYEFRIIGTWPDDVFHVVWDCWKYIKDPATIIDPILKTGSVINDWDDDVFDSRT